MKSLLAIGIFLFTTVSVMAQEPEVPPVIRTRVLKTDFFAPLTGNLAFSYEQALTNQLTLDVGLGIIGVGVIDDNLSPAGIFLKGGPRFYFSPDYVLEGMTRFNDFQGFYFKPELIYSGFGFDYDAYNPSSGISSVQRGTNHSVAVMLNLGKQWVLAKKVTLDIYGGLGYGWSVVDAPDSYGSSSYSANEDELVPNKYSHLQPDNDIPIAFSAGLNLGILMK